MTNKVMRLGIIDGEGTLTDVRIVENEADWVTNIDRRQIKLSVNTDMHERVNTGWFWGRDVTGRPCWQPPERRNPGNPRAEYDSVVSGAILKLNAAVSRIAHRDILTPRELAALRPVSAPDVDDGK